jgi:predicted ATPase
MRLDFFWIESYMNIKEQGFNLGSEFFYTVTPEGEKKDGTYEKYNLSREENKRFIPDFFQVEGNGLENVTAIIGENGSGKSNVLNFLTRLLDFQDVRRQEDEKYADIVTSPDPSSVLRFQRELYPLGNYLMVFSNGANKSLYTNIKGILISSVGFNYPMIPEFGLERKLASIFYSPIYDFRKWNSEKVKTDPFRLIDISANQQIMADAGCYWDWKKEISKPNGISAFQVKHLQAIYVKLLNFLIYLDKEPDGERWFKRGVIPKEIRVRIYMVKMDFEDLDESIMKLYKLGLKFLYIDSDKDWKADPLNFHRRILFLLWVNFFSHLRHNNKILVSTKTTGFSSETSKKFDRSDPWFFFQCFLDLEIFNYQLMVDKNGLRKLFELIKEIPANPNKHFAIGLYFENELDFKINLELAKKFVEASSEYLQEMSVLPSEYTPELMSFEFADKSISSGELAFFNLFASLNYANEQLEKQIEEKQLNRTDQQIFLLIDEGELGFHPRWQQQYIKNLIKNVPKIFNGKQVQLIFTSHSPISLSDLPDHHIVYLKREKEKDSDEWTCKVQERSIHPRTFAGNISSLLSHEFFLDRGFMGDFARGKIEKVIEWLNDEPEGQDKKKERKAEIKEEKKNGTRLKIIESIGEPLIRTKLESKYHEVIYPEVVNDPDTLIERQIEHLKKTIQDLEMKKGKNTKLLSDDSNKK